MKFYSVCPDCLAEDKTLTAVSGLINEERVIMVECSKGHKNHICLTIPKFSIFLEVGLNCYIDQYYNQAIAAFSTSLERFYEYLIKFFIYLKHGAEKTEESFKEIRNHSERQLGAYIALFFDHYGYQPSILSKKLVELRNDIIHKGKFASKEDVESYCTEVLDIYAKTLVVMQKYEMKFYEYKNQESTGIFENFQKNMKSKTNYVVEIFDILDPYYASDGIEEKDDKIYHKSNFTLPFQLDLVKMRRNGNNLPAGARKAGRMVISTANEWMQK